MKQPKPKTAAIVTIKAPEAMNKRGRKAIADWLRRTADDFEELGVNYTTSRFTARYFY